MQHSIPRSPLKSKSVGTSLSGGIIYGRQVSLSTTVSKCVWSSEDTRRGPTKSTWKLGGWQLDLLYISALLHRHFTGSTSCAVAAPLSNIRRATQPHKSASHHPLGSSDTRVGQAVDCLDNRLVVH